VISYGDYFTLLFESENTNQLEEAVRKAARDIENLNEGYMIQYQRPIDLTLKYRYFLISSEMLTSISDFITRLKFVTDDKGHAEIISLIEGKLDSLGLKSFSPYFRSEDGQLYGMIIRPSQSKKNLAEVREDYKKLQSVADKIATGFNIKTVVGGSHRKNLGEFDMSFFTKRPLVRAIFCPLVEDGENQR